MSVLITGVNGLVGIHAARILLEQGHEVVGCDSNRFGELDFYPEISRQIQFIWGDITNLAHLLEAVEKYRVEDVIHLASLRNEVVYQKSPSDLFRVNIVGTENILELARLGKIRRIVFASTAAVYGEMKDLAQPIPEDTPQNPFGIYANSKAMCESLIRSYRNVYRVQGFVVRPSRIYGRLANLSTLEFGNPLSSFIYKALKGIPIRDKSGADFGGDFTYAPDVAFGCYRALATSAPSHWIFNVSSGVFYRLSEVVQILQELFPSVEISVGPGVEPYVSQSPIRGPLDIRLAQRELDFHVERDLRGSIGHFVETLRQKQVIVTL